MSNKQSHHSGKPQSYTPEQKQTNHQKTTNTGRTIPTVDPKNTIAYRNDGAD